MTLIMSIASSNNDSTPPHAFTESFVLRAAQRATSRIAPVWPLDKSVAVNPWWQWRDCPMTQVAARLGGLHDVRLLMPKAFYRRQWPAVIGPQHLSMAAQELGLVVTPQALVDYLLEDDNLPQWKNLSDWLDEQPEQATKMRWRDEITQQISQSCGLFHAYPERYSEALDTPGAFYRFWRDIIRQDVGLAILMDTPELNDFFLSLPETPAEVIYNFYRELQTLTVIDEYSFENYCLALLLDINGWAAVFAQVDNKPGETHRIQVFSVICWRYAWSGNGRCGGRWGQGPALSLRRDFVKQFHNSGLRESACHLHQQYLWVWQRALELSVQNTFAQQLVSARPAEYSAPALQAVFCIDVRSEPMRRALEAVSPDIHTMGFAGFLVCRWTINPTPAISDARNFPHC